MPEIQMKLEMEIKLEKPSQYIDLYEAEDVLVTDHGYYDVKTGSLSEMTLPSSMNSRATK